ncbi:hypothetical protein N7495_008446 [Penicillium taxi]|uniref:uncharacterized protein n=1 Tax=Penicillium taxi TaxID=168475 RepID=UPI0025455D8B|nr:uncharacterized protein N7495_008446 [Penicillium taxi]KAJ5888405.1 hypothetical protein N7495_008446 [Penicillium taxi]
MNVDTLQVSRSWTSNTDAQSANKNRWFFVLQPSKYVLAKLRRDNPPNIGNLSQWDETTEVIQVGLSEAPSPSCSVW